MYTMKQACEITGLTYETLKFYCNKGIITDVPRNSSNHRVFTENHIEWLKNISCLRDCGMSINEMTDYVNLSLMGISTISERRDILNKKREVILEEIKKLEVSLKYINLKQDFYDDVEAGKVDYFSYLDIDSIK